ncbi:MAG: N-6 DNA methylase, partial [Candidatus Hermodarchaeota archaeon]
MQLAASIKKQVKHVFRFERENGPLHHLFDAIRKTLIYDLDIETFVDIYAQTVTYGLFSIKTFQTGEFSEKNIVTLISYIYPPLKSLFSGFIPTEKTNYNSLDFEELGFLGLVRKLEEVNIDAILDDFAKLIKEKDLVTHLYELFLKEYDSTQKFERGVFYTPNSIVSFIVRSVDYLLRTKLGYPNGLADDV